MADTLISADMKSALGRTYRRMVSYPVSESDIRRWAIAVYYPDGPPAEFCDAIVASQRSHGGIVAPEDFNPLAWKAADVDEPVPGVDPLDPDATEKRLGIEGPGLTHQLNGGLSVEYGVRMRPGDVITAVSSVDEYTEREGRLGPMLFAGLVDVWTNQDDDVVRTYRMTLIRY